MDLDENSIYQQLGEMRKQKANVTTATKVFLEALTGKSEWTEEQCHDFFDNLLRHYVRDEGDLDLLLAVSGLKDGYREPKLSAAKRRGRYLQSLQNNDIEDITTTSALEKREKKLLEQIAADLIIDIDSGHINKLLSAWGVNVEICDSPEKTPLPLIQQVRQWIKRSVFKRESMNSTSRRRTSSVTSESPSLTFWGRLKQWVNPETSNDKSREMFPKSDGAVIIISVITICLLFAAVIFGIGMYHDYRMALIRVDGKDVSSASITDANRDTGAESVYDLASNAQNRIVNIDDPEEYDVEAIRKDIAVKIMTNPAYGDMVAQGLRDIELSTGKTIGDYNPWLVELVEKTDEAMKSPLDQHPRGLEWWLEYHKGEGNKLFVTDEYFYGAVRLSMLLVDRLTLVGVREWESCENWIIDCSWKSSDYRAEKNSSQIICPALILQGQTIDGKIEFLIGFSLDDGRLLIYDSEQVTG